MLRHTGLTTLLLLTLTACGGAQTQASASGPSTTTPTPPSTGTGHAGSWVGTLTYTMTYTLAKDTAAGQRRTVEHETDSETVTVTLGGGLNGDGSVPAQGKLNADLNRSTVIDSTLSKTCAGVTSPMLSHEEITDVGHSAGSSATSVNVLVTADRPTYTITTGTVTGAGSITHTDDGRTGPYCDGHDETSHSTGTTEYPLFYGFTIHDQAPTVNPAVLSGKQVVRDTTDAQGGHIVATVAWTLNRQP